MPVRASMISLLALFVIAGCTGSTGSDDGTPLNRPAPCFGKCDGPSAGSYNSPYEANMDALNAEFPDAVPMKVIEDAFSVRMVLGEVEFTAPTHLFGGPVNVIPYSDEDGVQDASGEVLERRDEVIAKLFPPGDIGFMIKHHRPQYRTLDMSSESSNMKEHLKLQDTHIGIIVGVTRDGQPGAISLNNPQDYQDGLFGDDHYPMIFVRPVLPDYVEGPVQSQIIANIVTMMVGFNAVSNFPSDYNGGDPLAANSLEKLRTHVEMMVRVIGGDSEAQPYFDDPANMIYCAELAHVGASAGLHFPLNDTTMVPLVGQEIWDNFKAEVAQHNDGQPSLFKSMNSNDLVSLVELTLAPEDLKGVPEYASDDIRAEERSRLALHPMTMADIIEHFLRTHIPREQMGESIAPVQAAVLAKMRPGIIEATGMDRLDPTDPRRVAVDGVFDQVLEIVGQSYGSYEEFRAALEPVLAAARAITGPRDDTGQGLFVPPSLFHIVTQGKHTGGLMKLQYEGHGVHVSHVQRKADPSQPPVIEPVVEPDEPFGGTCISSCGVYSPDLHCACDEMCVQYDDCCDDYAEHCGN
jgi:Somatomedin B domain